jgi:peptide/nickel transport system permease protein
MVQYLAKRIFYMLLTLVVVSIVSFVVIQLPPGDWMSTYLSTLSQQGIPIQEEYIDSLKQRYGLGEPVMVQYGKWITGILLRGDFGQSMEFGMPVKNLLWERMALTIFLSMVTLLFSWVVSIGLGVYSATHQYSRLDYMLNFLSFVGAGTPGFLLALLVLYVTSTRFGMSVGGLFSPQYVDAPWSWVKFTDMCKHLLIPIFVLAVGSTAWLMRTTRANLLDELNQPYVEMARAKGLSEGKLLWKYPVRAALNPFFSTMGWSLSYLISGSTLVAIVLNLQMTGPILLRSLLSQDMYLAGSFMLLLSVTTVVGTFLSDVLLAVVDPRIRLEGL